MKIIISGGGIGGLAAALALVARGIDVAVYEQADEVRELGVGLQLTPEAVGVLDGLGLAERLAASAVAIETAIYVGRHGGVVWRESRGRSAGAPHAYLAVHRGRLLRMLLDALRAKGGHRAVRAGAQVAAIAEEADGVTVTLKSRDGRLVGTDKGDAVVAAEGIHSAQRRRLYPKEGPPRWSGAMLWRGALELPQFLDGHTLVVAGGIGVKCLVMPVAAGTKPGTQLVHWLIGARVAEPGRPPHREDWVRPGRLADVAPHIAKLSVPGFDAAALVKASPSFWEYPLCDRDPIPRWTEGRVTLAGDAAHQIAPVGPDAVSEAILDAAALADCLVAARDGGQAVTDGLQAYEARRREASTAALLARRAGGPEQVIDRVEERAPDGFTDIEAVMTLEARAAIVAASRARPEAAAAVAPAHSPVAGAEEAAHTTDRAAEPKSDDVPPP
ncbi:MAG: FAD-dependent monooxygenase [Hyphomicrobiaceae bacterium]